MFGSGVQTGTTKKNTKIATVDARETPKELIMDTLMSYVEVHLEKAVKEIDVPIA